MGFLSVLSYAHKLATERLQPGGIAIDATAGTGADTLFLAKTTGPRGRVFAFDIQEEALTLTRQRFTKEPAEQLAEVSLHLASHSLMKSSIPAEYHGKVSVIMFNLGYLPADRSDKQIITLPESTLSALESSLEMLAPGGVVTVVLYPGHEGGRQEAAAVEDWASALSPRTAQAIMYRGIQRPDAPYLIALERKKTL
ncbi:Predicted S-adenosylmethionine-dependent methyltransferase involved in cell envelope biogenesis [Paenibacillus uliginis N3/975]|uniref:Predicted S-adenosylmethionine-dependent methyltransferase involved in cell envelope biogenesis n=1 Tax=Paenibacillus uliginis N3/975 TaxID=1313296 RepID=A0A1X7GTR7_9BACL|nr:class I SAM-dependent methyltransferase [Paenibacillus uliginis]SMF74637.1 Predicted S-adenosylmethionine-dependent methyltransferase involved in cell envelope biogenesis [Paenibacillus uliginis N3/975]